MTKSLPKIIKSADFFNSEDVVLVPGDDNVEDMENQLPDEELEEEATDDQQISQTEENAEREKSEIILEKVQEEKTQEISRKILQNAREERERIIQSARSEADKLRDEAYKNAYNDALKEKTSEIESLLDELKGLMNALSHEQQQFFDEYEKGVMELSVEIAEKVVKSSVAQNAKLMSDLVREAVSTVRNADWISIEISNRLPQLTECLRNELSTETGFPQATEIITKDIPEGSCVIRTPNGVVDASVSEQFKNLSNVLEIEK